MALIHTEAQLNPGKLELLGDWLPSQDWAGPGDVRRVASFRLDDPAGQVGLETFLLQVGDRLVHVPLTYRGAPIDGGLLVGEMDHSTLGHRWVYDGGSDPVYRDTVTATILGGGTEAVLVDAEGTPLPASKGAAHVRGTGAPVRAGARPQVHRRPLPGSDRPGLLTATWPGQDEPVVLVSLT